MLPKTSIIKAFQIKYRDRSGFRAVWSNFFLLRLLFLCYSFRIFRCVLASLYEVVSVGPSVSPCFFQTPKLNCFLYENHRGSQTLTLLNVLGVLGVLNVLNVIHVLKCASCGSCASCSSRTHCRPAGPCFFTFFSHFVTDTIL